jgi:diacylglycerol kinase family enzyme
VTGFLLVNPRAGDARPSADELCRAAEERGLAVHLLRSGEDAAELARHADADALGVAGGDGSLAPVAAVAVERDLPFACVPFGTRNHFARDLGLDRRDPLAALDAFSGAERRIDVGRADGVLFLNNVSLGAYARLVHRRERRRRRGEALAAVRALGRALRTSDRLRARLDGRSLRARVLLVANNHYQLDLFSLGERNRLDEGLLHAYAATGVLPWSWHEETGERFRLEASASRLRAARDGEPVELEPPVDFVIEPRVLRVLVPRVSP